MAEFLNVDWQGVFVPDTPLVEIFVRGTIIYLGIFVLLRLVLRRETGGVGITDLLVVVLLADAAQNAMAGQYNSVSDGLFLVLTIIFWSYALQWVGYHNKTVREWLDPPPLLLVKDGKILRKNLRRELVTEEELMSQIRLQGASDLSEVKAAHMESDGQISVVSREARGGKADDRRVA